MKHILTKNKEHKPTQQPEQSVKQLSFRTATLTVCNDQSQPSTQNGTQNKTNQNRANQIDINKQTEWEQHMKRTQPNKANISVRKTKHNTNNAFKLSLMLKPNVNNMWYICKHKNNVKTN